VTKQELREDRKEHITAKVAEHRVMEEQIHTSKKVDYNFILDKQATNTAESVEKMHKLMSNQETQAR
jgi:hypothetical protein